MQFNHGCLSDLAWWTEALRNLPSLAYMRRAPTRVDPIIATDASLYGFGAALDMSGDPAALSAATHHSEWLAGRFAVPSVSGDMTLLEAWAVLAAIRHWGPKLEGCTTRIHVDNVSVEFALRKGRSFSPRVNNVLREILLLCLHHDICLHPVRIQSADNLVADDLSRLPPQQFELGRSRCGQSFHSAHPIDQHQHHAQPANPLHW